MSSTHVEEMSDLEVSAWIQNFATHEVINSHFMYEYTDIHPYPVANFNAYEGNGGIDLIWDVPEGGNATGYNIYLNGELLVENITDNQYSYPCEYGFYVFAVEALYENDMTSVKIVRAIDYQDHTSVAENQENVYNIYPNPTNGNITVCGEELNMVEVYNLCGQKVMTVEANSSSVNVNMSALTTGVYMVKIVDSYGNATVNKVVKR